MSAKYEEVFVKILKASNIRQKIGKPPILTRLQIKAGRITRKFNLKTRIIISHNGNLNTVYTNRATPTPILVMITGGALLIMMKIYGIDTRLFNVIIPNRKMNPTTLNQKLQLRRSTRMRATCRN